MTQGRPTPGRHTAARHRAPSTYERARDRALDSLATVADHGGRTVVATAAGGALAAAAVVGAQVAAQGPSTVPATAPARAGAATVPSAASGRPSAAPSAGGTDAAISARRQTQSVSRDASRPTLAQAKAAASTEPAESSLIVAEGMVDVSDPRGVARDMLGQFGWSASEFGCLDSLWTGESNWRVDADNPTSSAYGIPQALPGSKMASAGADWATNPATQISWGLGYIKSVYGSPCGAESFKSGHGWY